MFSVDSWSQDSHLLIAVHMCIFWIPSTAGHLFSSWLACTFSTVICQFLFSHFSSQNLRFFSIIFDNSFCFVFPLIFKIDFIYFIYLYFSQGLCISTCSRIYCVVHDDFRILILLSLPPKYCDCRHESLCLVYEVLGIEPRQGSAHAPTNWATTSPAMGVIHNKEIFESYVV